MAKHNNKVFLLVLSLFLLSANYAGVEGAASYYKGMSLFGGGGPALGTLDANQTIFNMKTIGVEWVSLVTTWYGKDQNDTNVQPISGRSDTDAEIEATLAYCASIGINVMFKPHVDLEDGVWRANIGNYFNADQWQLWFKSYTAFITHFAEMAQKYSNAVKLFSVGCEYVTPSQQVAQFRDVITAVRAVWKGPITYAANWGDEIDHLKWVDDLDIIGVDAYYPLTTSSQPSVQQLIDGWAPTVPHLANISKFWDNKKILFTEIGYKSIDGGAISPGDWRVQGAANETQQSDCYEVTLQTFTPLPWFQGVMWWAWVTNPRSGGRCDTDYTPQNKDAATTLQKWYKGSTSVVRKPQIRADPLTVYSNGVLTSGWENWSWGGTVDLKNTEHPYPGAQYSAYTSASNWGALALHVDGTFFVTNYTNLEFFIYASTNANTELQIGFFDVNKNPMGWQPVSKYTPACSVTANTWVKISIPVADLAPSNSQITQLAIQCNTGLSQWWIDLVTFN